MHHYTHFLASALSLCNSREAASHMMMSKCAITRLFLRNGCDIHEPYQKRLRQHPFISLLGSSAEGLVESPRGSEEPIWRDKSHCLYIWLQFLHDQKIDVDYRAADDIRLQNMTLLQFLIDSQTLGSERVGRRPTVAIFMLCAIGANVSARDAIGAQPLHQVAAVPHYPGKASYITAQFEILLEFGADPCARDDRGQTVTEIAYHIGWKEQWFQALRKCNKLQVVLDQIGAELSGQKGAPLDNAIRTGVDVTDLSTPSIKGLSKRIVARGDRLDD